MQLKRKFMNMGPNLPCGSIAIGIKTTLNEQVCLETGEGECVGHDHQHQGYGTQNYVCSQCLNHFCYHDECGDGGCLKWCMKCEKEYCLECVSHKQCDTCGEDYCNKCEGLNGCDFMGCEHQLCEYCFERKTCNSCNLILDVEIVVYLSFVITGTATKLFAFCVLALGIAGVESAMVADRNFVLLTVDDTYLNSAKKGMKVFV